MVGLLQQKLDLDTANETSSAQLKPIWTVPINRNPSFVGREEVFRELERKFAGQNGEYQRIAVLHGLGGIG